jgi:hypothetical protein
LLVGNARDPSSERLRRPGAPRTREDPGLFPGPRAVACGFRLINGSATLTTVMYSSNVNAAVHTSTTGHDFLM